MPNKIVKTSASVVIGASTSNPIVINQATPVGLLTSASVITGTTISFLVSDDATNFVPLFDETSTEVTLTAGSVARAWSLPTRYFLGWTHMKVRLGTSASAKLQATYNAPIDLILEML